MPEDIVLDNGQLAGVGIARMGDQTLEIPVFQAFLKRECAYRGRGCASCQGGGRHDRVKKFPKFVVVFRQETPESARFICTEELFRKRKNEYGHGQRNAVPVYPAADTAVAFIQQCEHVVAGGSVPLVLHKRQKLFEEPVFMECAQNPVSVWIFEDLFKFECEARTGCVVDKIHAVGDRLSGFPFPS